VTPERPHLDPSNCILIHRRGKCPLCDAAASADPESREKINQELVAIVDHVQVFTALARVHGSRMQRLSVWWIDHRGIVIPAVVGFVIGLYF
jgi:hypothetical protein